MSELMNPRVSGYRQSAYMLSLEPHCYSTTGLG